MMPRSTPLVVVLALALLSAGCIAGGPGGSSPTATDATETDDDTETKEATTPTTDATGNSPTPIEGAPYWERVADQPKPNQSITLENRWDRNATVRVRVVRNATGDVVHDRNYTLAPGTERDVYDTAAADPDGIEEFTVIATGREETERTSVWTNGCYAGVSAFVADTGSLRVWIEYANAEVKTDRIRGAQPSTVEAICQG